MLLAGIDGGQIATSLAAESLLPGSHTVEKMVALVAEGRVRQLVRVLGCDVDVGGGRERARGVGAETSEGGGMNVGRVRGLLEECVGRLSVVSVGKITRSLTLGGHGGLWREHAGREAREKAGSVESGEGKEPASGEEGATLECSDGALPPAQSNTSGENGCGRGEQDTGSEQDSGCEGCVACGHVKCTRCRVLEDRLEWAFEWGDPTSGGGGGRGVTIYLSRVSVRSEVELYDDLKPLGLDALDPLVSALASFLSTDRGPFDRHDQGGDTEMQTHTHTRPCEGSTRWFGGGGEGSRGEGSRTVPLPDSATASGMYHGSNSAEERDGQDGTLERASVSDVSGVGGEGGGAERDMLEQLVREMLSSSSEMVSSGKEMMSCSNAYPSPIARTSPLALPANGETCADTPAPSSLAAAQTTATATHRQDEPTAMRASGQQHGANAGIAGGGGLGNGGGNSIGTSDAALGQDCVDEALTHHTDTQESMQTTHLSEPIDQDCARGGRGEKEQEVQQVQEVLGGREQVDSTSQRAGVCAGRDQGVVIGDRREEAGEQGHSGASAATRIKVCANMYEAMHCRAICV